MARDNFNAEGHVCIYAMERDGRSFTGNIVCTVCGVKLCSAHETAKEGVNPEHLRDLDRSLDR